MTKIIPDGFFQDTIRLGRKAQPMYIPNVRYLLYDAPVTATLAPITTPRTCEPGPGTALIRDVESKIAITQGWFEWTAQATAAYADQDMVFNTPIINRSANKFVLCKWQCATDNPHYPLALVSSTTPTWNHTHVAHGFFRSGALALSQVDNATLGGSLGNFVADTEYWLGILLKSPGCAYYIKGGAWSSWTELGTDAACSTTPLYVASAGYTAVFSTQFYRYVQGTNLNRYTTGTVRPKDVDMGAFEY